MLTRILKVLARKESLSITQLAHEVSCSVKELESALEQMEHMGYIRREQLGQACSPSCGNERDSCQCEGCGFASTESYTAWVLTERGQTFIDSLPD